MVSQPRVQMPDWVVRPHDCALLILSLPPDRAAVTTPEQARPNPKSSHHVFGIPKQKLLSIRPCENSSMRQTESGKRTTFTSFRCARWPVGTDMPVAGPKFETPQPRRIAVPNFLPQEAWHVN